MSDTSLTQLGFGLIVLGFIVAFIAMIFIVTRSRSGESKPRGGGVLFIGPIPIIFGTDRESVKAIVVLTIILMLFFLVLMLIPSLLSR